jgi:hypothetical protein
VLEEAHGICAVALPAFEIPCDAMRLWLLTPYLEIAADRLDGLLDDAQSNVKLLAIQKAHRLQSPAWPPLRRFNAVDWATKPNLRAASRLLTFYFVD